MAFIVLMFYFVYTCVVLVLSTAYLSCMGLFVSMYLPIVGSGLFCLAQYSVHLL